MINKIHDDAKSRMEKSLHGLENNLAKIRAGRAHPSLLDNIMVSYYGNDTPLNQVAAIHVEGALALSVKPWEKQMTAAVEKAIRMSDLGLNPATTGDTIRVPLPPLSEERRKEPIKKVKNEGEHAKVAIRNIRRDCNTTFKDLQKDKEISEDEQRKGEDKVQKLTDNYIKKIDEILDRKEKDLMEI